MAKQIITTTEYTDDIDGGRADGTVRFSYEGTDYEIDLSKANAKTFGKVIAPYITVSRSVKATRTRRSSKPSTRHDLSAVRVWAAANGYPVSNRGRIAAPVIAAFEAANR